MASEILDLIIRVFLVLLAIWVLIFWIWMIVDCIFRRFRKSEEKFVWLLAIIFLNLFGAFLYHLLIKVFNPRGVLGKKRKFISKRRQ